MAKTKSDFCGKPEGRCWEKHQRVLHRRRIGHGRQESPADGC